MSDHTKTTAPALGKLLTMSEDRLSLITSYIKDTGPATRTLGEDYAVDVAGELAAQRREVARLTEDLERIEWLEQYLRRFGMLPMLWVKGKTVREAIDDAMKQDSGDLHRAVQSMEPK